jgi:fructose-bisphosphate aldolase class II
MKVFRYIIIKSEVCMALVNGNVILKKAQQKKYAVGAYNFSNLEQLQAILMASNEKKCDVIVQTSKSAIEYMGLNVIVPMVKALCQNLSIDVCLNLDHGKDFEIAKACIDAGYTNVMIDASDMSFDDNVNITKKVVEYAHKNGVSVEAELGSLKGVEDEVVAKESLYTVPKDAKKFVELTGVDSLAVSIGTSHGAYKFAGESHLDIERLKEITKLVSVPLVLHGASSVDAELKQNFVHSGGKIGNANGVSKQNLIDSVANGICKVNVDTDLRIAFTTGVKNSLADPTIFDPRKYLKEGQKEMKKQVEKRIDILTKNKLDW